MLSELRISNFRCFESFDCSLEGGTTLFVGENTQGKTSILESICVLMRLQSPRSNKVSDQIKFGAETCSIEGILSGKRLLFSTTGTRRRMTVDNESFTKRKDYLAETGLVVWIGNDDIDLIRGSAESRRRYLDFGASQLSAGYLPALRAYTRALRARNFLLKRDANPCWDQIDSYTKLLVQHGSYIAEQRSALISSLVPFAKELQFNVSGKDELLSLNYIRSGNENLELAYEQNKEAESRQRLTLVGPHRDDLELIINSLLASKFASEGQQRTIALSLKIAQSHVLRERKGSNPILLIDDIFGELDSSRRNRLLSCFPEEAQKIITTTSLDWVSDGCLEGSWCYSLSKGLLDEL